MATPVKDIQERKYFCASLEYDGVVEEITKTEGELKRAVLVNRSRYDREVKRLKQDIDVEEKKIQKTFENQLANLRRHLKQVGEKKDRLRKAIQSSEKYTGRPSHEDAHLVSKKLFSSPPKSSTSISPIPSSSSAFSPVQSDATSRGESSGCIVVGAGQGSASAKDTCSSSEMEQALHFDIDDDITYEQTLELLEAEQAASEKEQPEAHIDSCADQTEKRSETQNDSCADQKGNSCDDGASCVTSAEACENTDTRGGAVCTPEKLFTSASTTGKGARPKREGKKSTTAQKRTRRSTPAKNAK